MFAVTTVPRIDTLAAAKALKEAGLDIQYSEAIVAQLRVATEADRSKLIARGEFCRARWIHGAGIVAILGVLQFLPN